MRLVVTSPHAFCGVNISCERKELLVSNQFHIHAATKCHPSVCTPLRNAVALVNAVFGRRSDGARASHHLTRVLSCHCGQHRDRVRVCRFSLCVTHSHDPVCGECMETRMRMQCPLPQISQPQAGHGTHKAGHSNPTVIESSIYDCSARGDQLPCWLGSPRCATHTLPMGVVHQHIAVVMSCQHQAPNPVPCPVPLLMSNGHSAAAVHSTVSGMPFCTV